jgi:hypothetical protein
MCGTISGTGTGSTASKGCWAAQAAAWNGALNNQETAEADHQSVAAYSALAVHLAQILVQ